MGRVARPVVKAGLRRLAGQMVDWLILYGAPTGEVDRFRQMVYAAVDEALQVTDGGPNER